MQVLGADVPSKLPQMGGAYFLLPCNKS
eukprot:COSAG05_NODE_8724_length_677_cov_0.858131_1_plen_27_part_10